MLRIQTEQIADKLERAIRDCFFEPDIEKATLASQDLEGIPLMAVISTLQRRWQSRGEFIALVLDFRRHREFLIRHKGGLQVLVALRAQRPELLFNANDVVVGPLLELYKGGEPELRPQAYNVLISLKRVEAQERLAKLALDYDDDLVRDLVFAAGYEPRDPRDKALFYFLNGQWEKYERLDFDHSLLKAIFKSRQRYRKAIVDAARRGGRVELIKIISGLRKKRRPGQKLPEMSHEEWQLSVELLLDSQNWGEIWTYAQSAPPIWGLPLMRRLAESGWKPEKPAEAAVFADLTLLALDCKTERPPLGNYTEVKSKFLAAGSRLNALAMDAGGTVLATGGDQRQVRLWNLAKNEQSGTIQTRTNFSNTETYGVNSLALSSNGKYLAVEDSRQASVNSWVREVNIFDATRRTLLLQLLSSEHAGGAIEFKRKPTLAFTANNTLVYTSNGYIALWNIETRAAEIRLYNGADNCYAFSPDGKYLAAGNSNGTIRQWSFGQAQTSNSIVLLKGFRGSEAEINCMAFTPDGKFLLVGGADSRIRAYDEKGNNPQTVFSSAGEPRSLAVSPDGLRLATGHKKIIEIWSLPAMQPVARLEAHEGRVMGLAFTPDGRLVSLGEDGYVKIWTSRILELCSRYIEHASIDDLLFARQSLRDNTVNAQEQAWLAFVETLLSWQFQYEIEVEDWTEVEANFFDIELE